VVDLLTFKIVATSRTADLGLLEFHQSIKLDSEDRVFIDSTSSGKPQHGVFMRLSVPSLTIGPKCTYARIYDSAVQWHREPTAADACEAALGGAINLERYYQREFPRFELPAVCRGNAAEFCLWAGRFSVDCKYGLAERVDGHERVLFPGWVLTHHAYLVFSAARRSDIGEVKVPADVSARGLLAYHAGRDYLLLLQDGTHLNDLRIARLAAALAGFLLPLINASSSRILCPLEASASKRVDFGTRSESDEIKASIVSELCSGNTASADDSCRRIAFADSPKTLPQRLVWRHVGLLNSEPHQEQHVLPALARSPPIARASKPRFDRQPGLLEFIFEITLDARSPPLPRTEFGKSDRLRGRKSRPVTPRFNKSEKIERRIEPAAFDCWRIALTGNRQSAWGVYFIDASDISA
jgi:hypothetical protein